MFAIYTLYSMVSPSYKREVFRLIPATGNGRYIKQQCTCTEYIENKMLYPMRNDFP